MYGPWGHKESNTTERLSLHYPDSRASLYTYTWCCHWSAQNSPDFLASSDSPAAVSRHLLTHLDSDHTGNTISKCAPAMLVLTLLLQVLWLKFPYFTRRDLKSHVLHEVWLSRLVWSFYQSLSFERLLPWAILINTHVHFTLCKWYCVESVKQMASPYSRKGSQVDNRWYIYLRFAIF